MNPRESKSLEGFRLVSGPGALGRLVAQLRDLLSRAVPGAEERALVLLAVEEAAMNVLEHGYGNEAGRHLSIRVRPSSDGRLEVVVRDRAPVVDVTGIPHGDLKELARCRASRGRGLAMIRLLTRSVSHRPRPGGGNDLVLVFETGHLSRVIEEHLRDAA